METILTQCLLPSDQIELFREWAKEKSSSLLSSTVIASGEEDDAPINFNKTIAEEVKRWKDRNQKMTELNKDNPPRGTTGSNQKDRSRVPEMTR